MSRGRKPIEIDRDAFQMFVSTLETHVKFATRTELWKAVEDSEWAKSQTPRPLTSQVAMIKAEQLGLEIKTPKGRRGREKGCGPIVGGGRKKKVFSSESITALKMAIPEKSTDASGKVTELRKKLEKTINKATTGSLKAAVKLKCLDCTNWMPGEIGNCQIQECSLWNFRPYKRPSVVKELL